MLFRSLKVGKSIVLDGKMGMRKFWSVALAFSKVACVVKLLLIYRYYYTLNRFIRQLVEGKKFFNAAFKVP